MINNKIILILICILTLMLTITSISASDVNTNETMSIWEDPIVSTEIEAASTNVGSGSYQDLKNAISSSSDITLTGDITCKAGESEIIIKDKKISINGNGHTISGNNLKGIFVILPGSELTVSNLNLIKGNSELNTDKNYIDGGAILNLGKLTVKDCTFTSNQAQQGGAIACDINAITTITGTNTFSNNKVSLDGGAISNKGGSIITISGKNTFDSNSATSRADGKAGAILNAFKKASLYISGETIFTNNKASLDGGAIFNHQAFANVTGTNTFTSNQANGGDGKGGAINNENGTFYLSGTNTFTSNSANRGGAIDNNLFLSEFTITGTNTFNNNKANFQGGAIANQEATKFTMSGTNTFTSNSANNGGGAISVYKTPIYISGDNTFSKNTATQSGGAMHIGNSQTISIGGHSYFYENKATSSEGGSGGAIFAMEGSKLTILGAVFLDNSAVYGGAIFVNKNPLNAAYNIFSRNTASISGSDIEVFQSTVNSLEMNYWGTQSKPSQNRIHNYAVSNIQNWVVLQSTIPSEIKENQPTALIKFAQNSGANLGRDLGNYVVSATPNFDPNPFTITKNVGSTTYKGALGQISVTVTGPEYSDTKVVNAVSGIVKTTLSGEDVLLYVGESGNYIVTLKDANNKVLSDQSIVLTFNGKTYNEKTNNKGQVSLSVNGSQAGNYKIQTTFNGNENYEKSSTENYVVVFTTTGNNTKIIASNIKMYYKDGTRYAIKLTTLDGTPLSNMTVKIMINGMTYEKTTNNAGQTSLALNLNSKTYNVTTYFIGSGSYLPVYVNNVIEINPTIIASNIVKYFRNATQYTAKFLNEKGDVLTNTEVTFNINGVMYNKKTNAEGIAKLNINLSPNTYILTAINPINGEQFSNTITILPTIASENLVKYFRNGSKFIVRTLDGQGNPLAGQKVTFNINGVFYERTSNDEGYAKLSINLSPGDYIITTYTDTLAVSNNIQVLSKIKSDNLVMDNKNRVPFVVTVLDDEGNPIAGQKLSFNINGVLYERTSNATGNAKLNINLMPSQYIITTNYNGLLQSNTITIREV